MPAHLATALAFCANKTSGAMAAGVDVMAETQVQLIELLWFVWKITRLKE
jgi:hypothetical protein